MRSFTRFAWAVLTYNLLVVAWGAFVRATGSGAGCGKHWPMCNGQVVPRAPAVETVIEFTHRAMSGVALLLVVALVVAAVRAFPAGHPVRKAAWASLGLMILEALVGAGLVLFGWVAKDTSFARGWVMGVHLANTFLLLGALALTADWSAQPGGMRFAGRGAIAGGLWLGFASVLLAGVTGAVAALGDTLFPATSFVEGLRQELSTEAHVLLRLRVLHPFAAIATAGVLLLVARLALRLRPDARVRRAALGLVGLVAVELLAGVVNVALAAPVWLQLVHLLLADLIWIALVLLAAASLAPGRVEVTAETPAALPAGLGG
ncbi:COX15/CtaA family protein [Anaeromyxobacter terrae]|uniref:COX15/CtaA family protein n=1 Tax=Anaeromyxobacter terrae TaxID=2925406 RepID=UPI001F58644E|nr:COX15/CtaA family protein [Anaeromyxobacter sp. SG22]